MEKTLIEGYTIINEDNKFYSHMVLSPYDAPNFDAKWNKSKPKVYKTLKSAKKKIQEIGNLCFEKCKVVKIKIVISDNC